MMHYSFFIVLIIASAFHSSGICICF
uniref:Uncharacterized protein n=1 Tax=Anguilla anguilla TaxID=7936 RepID=A0A0E9U3J5_ANGAN